MRSKNQITISILLYIFFFFGKTRYYTDYLSWSVTLSRFTYSATYFYHKFVFAIYDNIS